MSIRATARQRLGQVATPAPLAEAMAAWALDGPRPPRTLLEPGSGSFVFTRAAQRRVPGLEATGVELDPQAGRAPPGVRHVIGDFLDDAVLGGAQFDAVLCNPPYVRHHHLEADYKVDLAARLGGRAGLTLSGLAGTHIYFLLRALELAAPGARVAFVTGAEWLEASYGKPLRRWLVERGWLRAVLVAAPEAELFPGVLSTAAVLLLEKSHNPGGVAHAVGLSAEALVAATAAGGDRFPRVALGADRWTASSTEAAAAGPRLGDRFRVRRGVATGANDFFVLDAARARALGIPERHLVPCLTGPRDLAPRRLLRVAPGRPGRALARYIAEGEAIGLHTRYLCRTRDPWYRVEEVAPAPLLLGYMARTGICVVDNRAGAVHLNLLHGIYPRPGTPKRMVAELRRFLESPAGQDAARASARRYAGGLMKLEPGDVERIRVPTSLA